MISLNLIRRPLLLFPLLSISLLIASCGGSNGTPLTTGTTTTGPAANNSVPLTVGFGPNGQTNGVVNGLYTTVTVCKPGTTTCATINNILVDTGSIGLRLIPSAASTIGLAPIILSGASTLEECIQYGDTSISWGPMELADVHLGGEAASNIPVQVIGSVTAGIPTSCISQPVNPGFNNGGNLDTLADLDANGILGIGDGGVDCGTYCSQYTAGNPYYGCANNVCTQVLVASTAQATNPVAAFSSSDRNGVAITLPSVPASGASTLSGTLTFGINTQSDNTMGSGTLYALDQCANLPTVTFNNLSYSDTACTTGSGGYGGFFDTGTGALNISDAATLAAVPLPIVDCAPGTAGVGFYCVGGSTPLPNTTLSNIVLTGAGGIGSGPVSLNIADGTALINTNNAVFNDIGADSVTSGAPSNDFFDFGMPWFLGRTVYLSIAGQVVSNTSNPPYGFVAF